MNFPSVFIKAGNEYTTAEKHIPAPLFRRSFDLKTVPEKAELLITGIGIYEVFLNGEKITKGYLAPYRSNPLHYVYFDKYDILPYLKEGKNTVGVILGNGLKNSIVSVWNFCKSPFRGAPETAFSVEITYKDGETELVESDENTLTAPSPIIFDDFHYGEYYDARKEIPGWNLPDFDDSGWKNALKTLAPTGERRLCEAEPIVLRREINPVSITEYEDGYIYDFGVNTAGLCRLNIKGERGQKVLLIHFETLVDNKPYLENFRFNADDRFQEDEYYLSGDGNETYTPSFTYHGFRYVLVSGITKEQATKDLLTYLEICSDLKTIGEFSCSDEVVNKIQEATVRSDTSNFYYFPTDCPQREKNGWTADASLSAEQLLLNLTPENSYKEWMHNIYKALKDNGQLPGIVPTPEWGYHWGNGPAWDNVIINLPYYTYIYRGDTDILKELSIPLMRYLNYLYSRLDEKELMAIGLGDWCQPDRREDNYDAPLAVTDTIMTNDIAQKAAFVYEVLGEEPQKQFALTLAEKTRRAFRKNLIDFDTLTVAGNTQTSQAMALYYGMFEENEKAKAFDNLLRMIAEKDGHMNTGVLGGRVIFRLLADMGHGELAYNMITRPDFPSYGNWIKRGATTLYEAFLPEGGRIISLNHHFWGDVSAWFYIYLAGIKVNPTRKDVTNVDISPCFIEKLTNVKAHHTTPGGTVSVELTRNDGKITLNVTATNKLHGTVKLPTGYKFEDGSAEKTYSGDFKSEFTAIKQ